LGAKQLGLLRELVPTVSLIGLLVNPNNENAEAIIKDLKVAAATIGVERPKPVQSWGEIPHRSEPLTDPRLSVMLAPSWLGAAACNSVS
jgi:hypothetical protein